MKKRVFYFTVRKFDSFADYNSVQPDISWRKKKNVSRFTLGVHAILNLITLSYCHDFSFQPWWLFFFFRLSLHSLEAALSSGCNHSVPNWILFSKILEFWNLDSYLLFWQSGRVSWVNVVSQKLDYSKTIIGKRNSHQN